MAHRWDQKPDRDSDHVVTCQKCGVMVEHVFQHGKWANYHTLPGMSRQRGLAPKCSESGQTPSAGFVATVERRPQLAPRQSMTSDERRLYEVKQLAMELFAELLPQTRYGRWSFEWDHARRRFGQCNYTRRVISLSKHWALVRPLEESRITIIHEIAHARTPGAGHGPAWVAEAQSLGIEGKRCSDTDAELEAKYEAVCHTCKRVYRKHRLTRQMRSGLHACKTCCDRYNFGKWSDKFSLHYIQQY